MSDTVEVRQPIVTVDDEATDSLSVSWTVPVSDAMSGSPHAQYSVHKSGGTDVESPTAEELIEKVADAQTKMFEQLEEKSILINDGVEESTFKGYDTGPFHSISFGGVNNGRTVVHKCARLGFINTAIYMGQYGKHGYLDEQGDIQARTISELLQQVLEHIVSNFEIYGGESDSKLDATALEIRNQVHAANKELIDEWYTVLDSSRDVELDGIAGILADKKTRQHAASSIAAIYVSSAPDFFAKISQFEFMFQMQFIPDPTGETAGSFISNKKMVNDAEEKTVSIRSLSLNAGPKSFLPVTGVVVTGLPGKRPYNTKESTVGVSVASWPETLPGFGNTITITSPNWILSQILPAKDSEVRKGTNLSPEENASSMVAHDDKVSGIHDDIKAAVTDFARSVYNNASLGSSRASIATVLDVTWEIGKRYSVTQDGGTKLFDGFLCGLEHRVTSTPDRVEAGTMLSFSHVEAGSFVLPNK